MGEEHGFPESFCPQCNPNPKFPNVGEAAATPAADWCAGHGLPESKCTKCNPGLTAKFKEAKDWCEEHGFPESVCPICNPQTPPAGTPGSGTLAAGTKIRFRSAAIEKAAGIEVARVEKATVGSGVACTAHIDFNRNRLADVRALVPGVVKELRADVGDTMKKGAPLFVLASTRVGELRAKARGLEQRVRTARANSKRKKQLFAEGVMSKRAVELAEQELAVAESERASARSALRLAGARSGGSGTYTLAAPIAGTVVRRPGVVGAYATAETSLATVADVSTMWALFDVPESKAAQVRVGQSVSVIVESAGKTSFRGEVTWVAAEVDPKTRMVPARAELPNPKGALRANQFARAVIHTGEEAEAVVVPRAAVQRLAKESVVFVRLGEGLYEPRVVEVGLSGAVPDAVQASGDLRVGEDVVTTGAFLLKTELSPDSIGAGCCEVEPPGGE